jgi:hypothetical protein
VRPISGDDNQAIHQSKLFQSAQNGSLGVDALGQCGERQPGGGSLHAKRHFNLLRSRSLSDCWGSVASCYIGHLLFTITLAL